MCGFAGVFTREAGRPIDPAVVRAMCDAIVRRGPDDEGQFVDGQLALGMRRLAIIDVAGGHQPIANEDETLWIVFNGEIFNHEELQRGLKARGHQFRTRSDTETILHLFEEEGPDCLHKLRGMFAIAIWNVRNRSLFLARDRLGIKPLHYAWDGRRLVFGSEIKAVLREPSVPRNIDWTALDAFFTYGYIPAPWTIHQSIRKLPAGHYLLADDRGVRIHQYWDLPFEPKLAGSERDFEEQFVELFREAVRLRLLSEVPLGAFLSGGLDSSMVVAMMAVSSPNVINTFTIGFGGSVGAFDDERPYARELSERFKTNHRVLEVQPHVDEALDAAVDAFDEPFADDSIIPTHHICQLARKHVTVALTGLGGDENFAGYERYLGFKLSLAADWFPLRQLALAARPVAMLLREPHGGGHWVNHLKRFLGAVDRPPHLRWQQYQALFTQADRRALYQPEIAREVDFDAVDRAGWMHFERAAANHPLDRALYQDIKMYLPDDILALTDRIGMWHSLELRVPFTDHLLVEFCARLPVSAKLRGTQKKVLLRRAGQRFLPSSVLNHRKQGFASPLATWLRAGMAPFAEAMLSAGNVQRGGVLVPSMVAEYLDAHRERRQRNDKQIFAMIMFQRWWQRTQA
jgi:asparagine synthase (glutamine-hydrolysing)